MGSGQGGSGLAGRWDEVGLLGWWVVGWGKWAGEEVGRGGAAGMVVGGWDEMLDRASIGGGKKGRQAAGGKRMGKELGNGKGWQAFTGQEREAQASTSNSNKSRQAFAKVVSWSYGQGK